MEQTIYAIGYMHRFEDDEKDLAEIKKSSKTACELMEVFGRNIPVNHFFADGMDEFARQKFTRLIDIILPLRDPKSQ